MLIPTIPPRQQDLIEIVNQPDGTRRYMMHPQWHDFLSQLIIEMQKNVSQEGFNMPQQTATNISTLESSTQIPSGNLLYDSDNNLLKVKINGTFKTITTS